MRNQKPETVYNTKNISEPDSKLEMMACLALGGSLAFVHGSLSWIVNCHEVHACFAAAHEACPCLPSDGKFLLNTRAMAWNIFWSADHLCTNQIDFQFTDVSFSYFGP